ncbi:MAG: shikimate kinase [Gemmatimonadales bacterium]
MPLHILLVGLPGAGKTTVGRLVSEDLGAPLHDIDQILERQVGRPVDQIFGMMGEPVFRGLEKEAVAAALAGDPGVIVPGGGWAVQPGQLETGHGISLIIYLKCTAGTAARRSEGGEPRPLLAGADPVQRMRVLLEEREPFYCLADHEVSAGTRNAVEVAREVAQLAREKAGWV